MLILDALAASHDCRKCRLCSGRSHVVSGDGNATAVLVFIGEAPGYEEDRTGKPFVGAAGKLLDHMLDTMKLTRDQVFITNAVRCRPPQNRAPGHDELEACSGYLWNTLRALPLLRFVVTLGNTPLRVLSSDSHARITAWRGRWFDRILPGGGPLERSVSVMPTFHPAYLLRNPKDKGLVWEDLKMVIAALQEAGRG